MNRSSYGERAAPPRALDRVVVAAVVVTLVPIVTAVVRAVLDDWLPVGDNALFAIRAEDVFTAHHPLLGLWSSASVAAGIDVNHPGPLLFDVLALPVRLFGAGPGTAVGIGLLNSAAVVGIVWMAYRRGGAPVAVAATATTAALAWAMGSEILFEPIQVHSALLPFLCFIVLVWSATCGDLIALPLAIGVGSLVAQTHLSYGLLVPVLGVWAVAGLGADLARRRRQEPNAWPGRRRRAVRTGVVAGAVFLVAWAQPFVEQLFGSGRGNLSRLASALGDPAERIGYGRGLRLLADVLAVPPWWFRPSFRDTFVAARGWTLPSPALTAAALGGTVVVLAACTLLARRDRDGVALRGLMTVGALLAGAVLTFGRGQLSTLGIAPNHLRWLWATAAFTTFVVVMTLARALARSHVPIAALVVPLALVTVVFAVLNLPKSDQGVTAPSWSVAAARDLNRQLSQADLEGTVLVVGEAPFGDSYSAAVLLELQREGVPFLVGPELLPPTHLDAARAVDADANPDATLELRYGPAARNRAGPGERVAFQDGFSREEREEFARLQRRVEAFVEGDERVLNDRGRAALAAGRLPELAALQAGDAVAADFVWTADLERLVRGELLAVDDQTLGVLARFLELRRVTDARMVGAFLERN